MELPKIIFFFSPWIGTKPEVSDSCHGEETARELGDGEAGGPEDRRRQKRDVYTQVGLFKHLLGLLFYNL